MKRSLLYTLAAAEGMFLASCVYTPAVPDMPYHGSFQTPARPNPAPVVQPAAPAAPEIPAPRVEPVVAAAVPAPPAPTVAPKPAPLDLTKKPDIQPAPVDKPAPAASVAEAPAPTPAPVISQSPASSPQVEMSAPALSPIPAPKPVATDPKLITNTGSIPYATPVEGDPTRVYNPLDPSKKIRIIDKNGNRYPSGKELKVRGTNYHFYVP